MQTTNKHPHDDAAYRTLSRADFVYFRLRDEIRGQTLRPGDRLREIEISERLAVSRTPVREALQRLETDGLIELSAFGGLCVTRLTPGRVMEIYALREILVGAAARFAATHASSMEIQTMLNMVEGMASAQTPEQAANDNRVLHQAIIEAAHNDYLKRAIDVLSDALILLGSTTYATPGRIETGFQENQAIIHAIARRDPDAAEAAARKHIHAAGQLRLELMFTARQGV